MCLIILYCNHPVSGKLKKSFLEVHKDELLPTVLDKAYELMKLAPHIPIERCRLVKYDYECHEMEQSLDCNEFQHLTIGQIMDLVGCYSLFLFLETRKENEIFEKYNAGNAFLFILDKKIRQSYYSLQEENDSLQKILHPQPDALRPLSVYESKM
ncbi:PREDICTED: ubiquitin carboxyl-terminal hydrolase 47-like, partial [Amphimedon queenslandica]|uniref:Uncharacterized protein n=1 Tax=Amphimedon queenslandica TaxID=400682 RepID=A0AAN0JWT0_AMPQE